MIIINLYYEYQAEWGKHVVVRLKFRILHEQFYNAVKQRAVPPADNDLLLFTCQV